MVLNSPIITVLWIRIKTMGWGPSENEVYPFGDSYNKHYVFFFFFGGGGIYSGYLGKYTPLGGSWYLIAQVSLHFEPNSHHIRALKGLVSGMRTLKPGLGLRVCGFGFRVWNPLTRVVLPSTLHPKQHTLNLLPLYASSTPKTRAPQLNLNPKP